MDEEMETFESHLDDASQVDFIGIHEEQSDVLGLDQPLKLVSRAKIARIDDERMLINPNGIKYIAKNYNKVNRIFKKNDLKLSQKIANTSHLTSSAQRRLKYENEYNNLSSILEFYQLWGHGLFPKANFKDCIKLLRAYGLKSSHMKLYRRELLDQQIMKLRKEKGIIEDGEAVDFDINENHIAIPLASVEQHATHESETAPVDEDDDDWSFMNRSSTARAKNSLFIDDDEEDELYTTPQTQPASEAAPTTEPEAVADNSPEAEAEAEAAQNIDNVTSTSTSTSTNTNAASSASQLPESSFADFSDFSDDEEPKETNKADDYEMDLMREMGL